MRVRGVYVLGLNNSENPVCLPNNFYKLKSIRYLYLYGCSNLVIWPDNLFSAIGGACLTGRPGMQRDLHGLQELILRKCKTFKSLPELPPSLKHLDAHDFTSLEEVSSIKKLFEQALLLISNHCSDTTENWAVTIGNTGTPMLQMLLGAYGDFTRRLSLGQLKCGKWFIC
ncbi:hypothetical protein Gotur_033312 [Gossypium turneri]